MVKEFFVHGLNMVILNAHILHKKYSEGKKTLAVQDRTSKAHVE